MYPCSPDRLNFFQFESLPLWKFQYSFILSFKGFGPPPVQSFQKPFLQGVAVVPQPETQPFKACRDMCHI